MQVYQLDVLQRHNYIKSSITSTFGKVIKLDSTKKITKKMAGRSSHTAMWATNVGNEYGQVLMSVLTVGEGQGLEKMIQGLISRYMTAQMPAPKLLYVDRDCCGGSSIGRYFYDWPFLHIRLDIWHFMRRLSTGCTSDAHQLYGTFMGHISKCIFKWDQGDVQLLKEAKKAEMLQHGIPDPSDTDVLRYIKPSELSIHCRRMTRGVDETTTLLSQRIESLSRDKGKDVMGVHLFDEDRMRDVWAQQSRHVGCIQDPANISLYTKIKTMKKGGIELPVFRCARGSTSLESFHLHMNRFIPGTLASDINFQVYVLDGIFRWNEDSRKEAVTETSSLTTYEGPLQHSINQLSEEVYGKKLVTDYRPPSAYTGELIGIEYLYSQSSEKTVKYQEETDKLEEGTNTDEEETANDEDGEELEDYDEVRDVTIPPAVEDLPQTIQRPALHPSVDAELQHPSQEDVRDQPQVLHTEKDHTEKQDESDVGPDNIPGYTKVLELATFLVSLMDTTAPLSTFQIDKIIQLWNALSEYDKKRTVFPERYAVSSGTGRFKSPKRKVAPGVVSMQRVILGPNAEPASRPSCNRYVEATITLLLQKIRSDRRPKDKKPTTRWNLINQAYGVIASQVNNSPRVISLTDITLPRLNSKTILEWYNKKEKALDLQICQQGLELPTPKMTTTEQAPPQLLLPNILPFGTSQPFKFDSPPDTSGMTVHKKRYRPIMPAPVSLLSQTQACLSTSPLTVSVTPKVSQQKRPKPVLRKQSVICNQCGGDRTASSHKQYRGYRYCPNKEHQTYEEWRGKKKEQFEVKKNQ